MLNYTKKGVQDMRDLESKLLRVSVDIQDTAQGLVTGALALESGMGDFSDSIIELVNSIQQTAKSSSESCNDMCTELRTFADSVEIGLSFL